MKKIQHHFVSETYLRNFTNKQNKIFVLTDDDKIFDTNPNNIFKENHYNTVNGSLFIEDSISEIEGAYNTILKNKILKSTKLTDEEKTIFSLFVAFIHNRVRIRHELMEKSLTDLLSWADNFKGDNISSAVPSSGKTINIENIRERLKDFNPEFAGSSFRTSFHIADLLCQMKWRFLVIDSDDVFISSDNPAHLCRPTSENKYGPEAFGSRPGFIYKDAELTIPLTPQVILLASWINNADLDYLPIPDNWVCQFNYRTMRSANWLISNKKEKLEEILKKFPYKKPPISEQF